MVFHCLTMSPNASRIRLAMMDSGFRKVSDAPEYRIVRLKGKRY